MLQPLLSLWGLPPPPRCSCSCASLTPAHEVQFSPLPRTSFAPRLGFARFSGISPPSLMVGAELSKPFAEYLSVSVMWSCRGTLRLVTSAPHPRFALGTAWAGVTLVGRLKCLDCLPPHIFLSPPSWASSRCSVTATPTPPSSHPLSWHLTASRLRSILGRYIKTRLGYARPPGRRLCPFGTPSGDRSPGWPPYTVLPWQWAPLRPPAPLRRAGPYFHFLAQADTHHLSDIIFLCQGFIHSFCSPFWFFGRCSEGFSSPSCLLLSILLPWYVSVCSWDLVGRWARYVVGLIPDGLGGLDVSWGEEDRVFVGHSVKAECCLCTLNKCI